MGLPSVVCIFSAALGLTLCGPQASDPTALAVLSPIAWVTAAPARAADFYAAAVAKDSPLATYPAGISANRLAPWPSKAVTAECWANPTVADTQGSPRLLSNAWADNSGRGFMLWSDHGSWRWSVGYNVLAGPPVVPGKLAHLVGTYDASVPHAQRFYVNAQTVAQQSIALGGYNADPSIGDYPNVYVGQLNATNNNGPGLVEVVAKVREAFRQR